MKYEIKQAGALGKTVYIYENDTIREAGMLGKFNILLKMDILWNPVCLEKQFTRLTET